jgi:DNA polymerase-3 subunit alpha
VGRGAAESMVAARKDKPFDSLDDFCGRLDLRTVNRKTIESLVKAGAMDCLMPGLPIEEIRARLMHTLDETMDRQGRIKADLARGQGLLFGGDIPVARPSDPDSDGLEKIEPWHEHDLLQAEREVLGFYISGHPLVRYKDRLAVAATHRVAELASLPPEPSNGRNGRGEAKIRLAGIINQVKKIVTKKGDPMARVVLEDLTGEINVIAFPKVYAAVGNNIRTNSIVVVTGRLAFPTSFKADDSEKPPPELHADEIMPLELAISRYAQGLTLQFSTAGLEESLLEQLKDLLRSHPGSTPVFLRVNTPAGQTLFETHERVALEDALFDELGRLLGEKSWQIQNAS